MVQLPNPPYCPGTQVTYLFSYVLTALQVMVPIGEDLRLHNGHDAILLASAGITGQNIGVFHDGKG